MPTAPVPAPEPDQPPAMSADEMRGCLEAFDMSTRVLARMIDWDDRTLRRMCMGTRPVDPGVAALLRLAMTLRSSNPRHRRTT